jgi:hypothetical protein
MNSVILRVRTGDRLLKWETGHVERYRYANADADFRCAAYADLTREHLVAWADEHGGGFIFNVPESRVFRVAWRVLDALHRHGSEET